MPRIHWKKLLPLISTAGIIWGIQTDFESPIRQALMMWVAVKFPLMSIEMLTIIVDKVIEYRVACFFGVSLWMAVPLMVTVTLAIKDAFGPQTLGHGFRSFLIRTLTARIQLFNRIIPCTMLVVLFMLFQGWIENNMALVRLGLSLGLLTTPIQLWLRGMLKTIRNDVARRNLCP